MSLTPRVLAPRILAACVLGVCVAGAVESALAVDSQGSASRKRIDEVLTQLQARSDGLKDIQCSVRLVEKDEVNLSERAKYGDAVFLMAKPNPHFFIRFSKTAVDGILGKREWYLFDGRWLYQVLERIRQVTKQEIVREGEVADPFDLENAPFPLPFGQKKETILRNFDVTLVAPSGADPANTDHLVCVPKANSAMKRRYDKLEFFVLRDIHLPSRIVVTRNGGLEVVTADFLDLTAKSINTGITRKAFRHPKEWGSYTEVLEELPSESKP